MTATALHETLKGVSGADKAAALIAAGYVNSRGTADYTAFYTAVLAERKGTDPISDRADLMLHYVNNYYGQYDIATLKLQWETYSEQAEIDGEYHSVDAFIEEYGMKELGFYSEYADAVNDYPLDVVDAFIKEFGISCISHLRESYYGVYSSVEEFAEEYFSNCGETVPTYIVADWTATWNQGLRYEFSYDDTTGAVFLTSF
jgi:hypothetical protein